jgi:hypothetical protein
VYSRYFASYGVLVTFLEVSLLKLEVEFGYFCLLHLGWGNGRDNPLLRLLGRPVTLPPRPPLVARSRGSALPGLRRLADI